MAVVLLGKILASIFVGALIGFFSTLLFDSGSIFPHIIGAISAIALIIGVLKNS